MNSMSSYSLLKQLYTDFKLQYNTYKYKKTKYNNTDYYFVYYPTHSLKHVKSLKKTRVTSLPILFRNLRLSTQHTIRWMGRKQNKYINTGITKLEITQNYMTGWEYASPS